MARKSQLGDYKDLTARYPAEQARAFEEEAKRRGVTLSAFLRWIADEFFSRESQNSTHNSPKE